MAVELSEKGGPHDRARIVRRYLSALDSRKPGRTPARTAETVQHRMHQIDTLLLSADPVTRLHLTQERIDLHAEQLRLQGAAGIDFEELQKAFVRVAKAYGDRHDVTYSAWRQVGVDAEVLAKAGIHQQSKPNRTQPAAAGAAPAAPEAVAALPSEPAKKEPAKKAAKKAPAKKTAAKATAETNGAPADAKKAPAKKAGKATEPQPEQQQLTADATS